mmetsp:Transcript_25684/g.59401  ORF Transcript_25684/g.59401 Transcript_25684/m.59401 type:complete len:551 (+) Transcript_25684:1204-2856(+)
MTPLDVREGEVAEEAEVTCLRGDVISGLFQMVDHHAHSCPRIHGMLSSGTRSRQARLLCDSGATHGFMSPAMATALGLSIERTGPPRFKAAGGTMHACCGMVRGVRITLRSSPKSVWECTHDFAVADIGCADVILGIPFWCEHQLALEYNGTVHGGSPIGGPSVLAVLLGGTHAARDYQFRVPTVGTPEGDALNMVEHDRSWEHKHRHRLAKAVEKSWTMSLINVTLSDDGVPMIQAAEETWGLEGVASSNPPGYDQAMANVRTDPDAYPGAEAFTEELVRGFDDVFQEPMQFPPQRVVEHKMVLEGPVPPGRKVARYSLAELDAIRDWVNTLLKKGWLEPSRSPTGAPILCVTKPDGSFRIVQDFRLLNAVTKKVNTPLPVFDNLLKTMSGCRYWSCLDISQMYWQIRIAKEDRELCAVATPFGQYQLTVMPMGLSGAPLTAMLLMADLLCDYIGVSCSVFMDDICVHTKDLAEHKQVVQDILTILRQEDLHVALKKCSFLRKNVRFLGHIIGMKGLQAQPERCKAVRDWPRPTTVKDLRAFLGLCSYY